MYRRFVYPSLARAGLCALNSLPEIQAAQSGMQFRQQVRNTLEGQKLKHPTAWFNSCPQVHNMPEGHVARVAWQPPQED